VDAPRRANLSHTWALVPIRGLESAKSRLGGDLDAEERLQLVTELLRRTLVATRDSRRVVGTIVVTMDGDAAELAGRHGAIGLVERAPGLNEAIEAARSVAVARGATAVLVLPADLPAVSSEAVDELISAASGAAAGADAAADRATAATGSSTVATGGLVALVGDRHGAGTNALLLSPPSVIAPAFGAASREAHARAATEAGARFVALESPLTLDVDTSADLLDAEATMGSLRG
jgi:2-phospho-L-lactate/phosphoenolpyruvate guanylyltransferase